ncbi:MAG: hypothetical protein ACRCXT_16265 [Paraclostridium sp.]
MNIKYVTLGAAGNKNGINLIEKGIAKPEDVLLINSTLKDVPDQYKSSAICYSNGRGCGKDTQLAKQLVMESIEDGTLDCLDKVVNEYTDLIVLIASTEGGTGAGSIGLIAKYYTSVIGIPVHCALLTGFEEDGRGLQNTLDLFQDMDESYTIEVVSNKKFLDSCSGNKLRAEKAANDELAKRMEILSARNYKPSEQNIDETDLLKVASTPGYMIIESVNIDKTVKNIEQVNILIDDMIDDTKSFSVNDKAIKRLAVFLNISPKRSNLIDYNFDIIKEKLGVPYEVFTHVQYDENLPESISIIASGLNMPIEEVRNIYDRYKTETSKINISKDKFFDFASTMQTEQESNKKADFLRSMSTMENIQPQRKEISTMEKSKKDFVSGISTVVRRKKAIPSNDIVISDSPAPTDSNNRNTVNLTREDYINKY